MPDFRGNQGMYARAARLLTFVACRAAAIPAAPLQRAAAGLREQPGPRDALLLLVAHPRRAECLLGHAQRLLNQPWKWNQMTRGQGKRSLVYNLR